MNKIKGIRSILFIITFVITLFLIYISTAITVIDSGSNHKGSPLPKTAKNNAIKNNPESNTSNTNQLSDVSSETDADQQIALLNEEDNDDRTVISRGASDRNTYHEENQLEKPITPTATSDAPTEVKSVIVPIEIDSQYENDLDLLARLITAEAQGEPYEAKVAVGAVVMNRVKSGLWATTINDVIYQNINGYYQFTPVVNGWINKPAEPESIKAATAAMSGADPTSGAQFYYDDKSTNTWILSKSISVQIGHLIYAY